MTRFVIARGLIGVAVLLGASLAAPTSPRAVAVDAPVVRVTPAPVLIDVDVRALTTPAAGDGATFVEAPRALNPGISAGSTPAVATPPLPQTPREVFLVALRRSSWPLALHGLVEARVACESGFDASQRNHEDDGSTSHGLLMVNDGAHPELAARYDLTDPLQNLNAGKIVADKHARAGLPTPWQHCDRIIAARAKGE